MIRVLAFALLLVGLCGEVFAQRHVGPGQQFPDLPSAAAAKAIGPGDTVYIHAGTYRNSSQYIDGLIGTPDKWITIRPFGKDSVSINEQYNFTNAQYVHVTGLHFYGNDPTQTSKIYHQLYFDYQYNCFGAIHDIVVDHCTFADLNNAGKQGSGAMLKFTGTDRFLVDSCSFRNGTNMADGISMNGDRNGVIRNCTFENLPIYGSHCKGGTKNIIYERSTFINCEQGGIEVGGDTGPEFFCPVGAPWEADSILVASNVFIGGRTGIRLAACHNSVIANNTCYKQTQFAFRTLNASSNTTLDNNLVINNIFTTYTPNGLYMNASANFDYSTHYFKNNLFHDYYKADPKAINWSELPGAQVEGSIIADPMFTDTAKRDFSLRKGSLAIGAGADIPEPVIDLYGKPFVTPRSIGASEGGVQLSVRHSKANAHELRLSPNPATSTLTLTWEGPSISSVEVLDLLGKRVLSTPYSGSLSISNFISGEYLLIARDRSGAQLAACRFIKL